MKLNFLRNGFANLDMRKKILVVFSPILCAFLVAVLTVYAVMMTAMERQLQKNSFQTLQMIENEISASLNTMENAAKTVISSESVQEYFYSDPSVVGKKSARATFTRLFNNEINQNISYAKGAYLIRNQDDYIYIEHNKEIAEQGIKRFATAIYEKYYTIYAAEYILPLTVDYENSGVLHYVMPVPNLKISTTEKALFILNISPNVISNVFSKYYRVNDMVPGTQFLVTDYNGRLVCEIPQENGKKLGSLIYNVPPETGYQVENEQEEAQLVMHMRMDKVGWVITIKLPMSAVLAPIAPYHGMMLTVLSVSLLIFFFLLYISVSGLVERLDELLETIETVRYGALNERFPVRYRDEVSRIGGAFNRMLDDIQHLRLDIAEQNLKQREAEMQALQSQINPHFLYNTLESIRMLALEDDSGEVAQQIKTLSDSFRYTISPGGLKTQVRIGQELNHVYDYLTIQSFRFVDRYDVQVNVDEDILEYWTIKLILQPIVENAFIHGVHDMRRGGQIVLTGKRVGDLIRFTVADNGIGMQPEKLAQLRQLLAASPHEPQNGGSIGIVNVSERLVLAFGEEFALKIDSQPHEGTTVILEFPVLPEEKAH